LVSVALHDYLRVQGDLSAIQPAPTALPTITTPTTPERIPRPIPPNIEWKYELDGSRYCTAPNDDDWGEGELEWAYSKGSDPLKYYT
jgi:hypothetical protein